MAVLILDPSLEERVKAERERSEASRYDEVWEGVHVMAPLPSDEHREIATRLGAILQFALGWNAPDKVYVGVNVSDREEGWEHNYRCPDVAVFLRGTRARDCGTHWCGGPDFAVEIISPKDRTREKVGFYAQLGTRELLIIDRDPWALEFYRPQGNQLAMVGHSTLEQPVDLASAVLPLRFRLVIAHPRPQIEASRADSAERWLV